MTIERLPSGSYRIKQMYEGKVYAKTIDHKPSAREAAQIMSMLLSDSASVKGTFKEAALKYVSLKENILSPRTIKEYGLLIERFPEWFMMMQMSDINQEHIQRMTNELAVNKSPKTVRTYHGFMSAVLALYRPNLTIRTTLPQKIKNEPYIPTIDDIKTILKHSERTRYEIALRLGCMGLRRSEVCALTPLDLTADDVLIINKALVQDKDKKWVIKATKTTESTRQVPLPHDLAERIREQGYIFNGYPGTISTYLRRTQDKYHMPHFSFHKMRHFFASQLLDMGVNQKDIMSLGGWKTDSCLKVVYQHSIKAKTEEGRRQIVDNFVDKFL